MARLDSIDMGEAAREHLYIRVRVTGVTALRRRLWLTSQLLAFVEWVSPVPLEV